jgi:ribonuclease HII
MTSRPDIKRNKKDMPTPNFFFERKLWRQGFSYVAGVDEVGRGCFAGPVVAAAVSFDKKVKIPPEIKINDSKKLTPKQREKAEKWIKENSAFWGIGEVSASVINRLGMAKATKMAFRRAINNANNKRKGGINFLLIDAFYIPYLRGFPSRRKNARKNHNLTDSKARQLAIVNGDEKSISIAAASILAKVYRDSVMRRLGEKPFYKKYGWIKNKGYGTYEHREAIKKYGITRYHRRDFIKTFLSKKKFSN